MDIKRIRGAYEVYLLWGWGNTFPFERSLLHFLCRLIWRNSGMQLDTGFMPEINAPGFYERNFPLPRKAFRDARWKLVARESGMKVGQVADFQADMEIDVFFSDQQQFNSSLKVAPYMAKGEDVIFIPGFNEGRKSSFRGAKEVSPCPVSVVASSGTGSLENIQSAKMGIYP